MLLILVNRRTVVLPKRVRGVSDKAKVLENSLKVADARHETAEILGVFQG